MEGYKDPFKRRPSPWGREEPEFLAHFQRLGRLRQEHPALRLGDIHFFATGDKHLGFTRSLDGKTYRIYCTRSGDSWEIPSGKLVFGYHLQIVAPDWLPLGPRGYCITEE